VTNEKNSLHGVCFAHDCRINGTFIRERRANGFVYVHSSEKSILKDLANEKSLRCETVTHTMRKRSWNSQYYVGDVTETLYKLHETLGVCIVSVVRKWRKSVMFHRIDIKNRKACAGNMRRENSEVKKRIKNH